MLDTMLVEDLETHQSLLLSEVPLLGLMESRQQAELGLVEAVVVVAPQEALV